MPQQQQEMMDRKKGFYVLLWLARAHALTLLVFLHWGFGVDALGRPAFYSLVLLLLCFGFSGDPVIGCLLLAFLGAMIVQRIITVSLLRRGRRWHSLSEGIPLLSTLLGIRTKTARGLEPTLCFFTGIALGIIAEANHIRWLYSLAGWIALGTISIAFDLAVTLAIEDRRVQSMIDAKIEQEYLARRYREQMGEE